MPIILLWNTIALPQAPTLKRILGDMNYASAALQKGLSRRLSDAEKAEMLTRAYPVFRFTDEAVSAYVTRAQAGAALSVPSPGWGARLAGLGPAWNLPGQIAGRVHEATLLPRLAAILHEITGTVRGSVARFREPSARMFEEGAVSAVDIFGMGALAFRAIGAGRAGIYVRMKPVARAIMGPDTSAMSAAAGAAPLSDLPLDMRLDEWTRDIAGALILLPAVSALAMILGPDVIQWLRHETISELAGIESAVFDIRSRFLAGLSHAVTTFSEAGIAFLIVARDYAISHLDHWVRFSSAYLFGLHGGLTAFVGQLSTFWEGVRNLIAALIGFGNQIIAIDLTELIHRALVAIQHLCDFMIHFAYNKDEKPARYVAPGSFPVTVEQLLLGEGNGQRARDELARGMTRMRALLAGSIKLNLAGAIGGIIKDFNFAGLIAGLDLLGSRLNREVRELGEQPVLRYTEDSEPDLAALVVRPAREGLSQIVDDLGNRLNTELQATANGMVTMLDNAAGEFDLAGASAARSSLHRVYRQLAEGTDAFAARAFPPETRGPSALAPVAEAFAMGVAGAFRTMEAALGGFLGFVMAQWRSHLERNVDTPVEVNATSPRILLERARLGRVHMPEMVIRLRAAELDQATARRIAAQFASEVRSAYARGEDRLSSWRTAASSPAPGG
ncbi:hypothetical protein ACUSIJ_16290 [Pseudochelatococcus sp. B33]